MKNLTAKPYVVFSSLFLIVLSVVTVSGAHQLEYEIGVHVDGSARWIIEHRFLLDTDDDEMMFRQYSNWTYFSDYFIKNVRALMNTAKLRTGREYMTVENFKMTVDVFDSYRVVKYEFDWIGFAEVRDNRITLGDVFEVEGLFLHGNGTLNLVYPSGYVLMSATPRPNVESDETLTWYEVENFDMGEPRVVLKEKKLGIVDRLKSSTPIIIVLVVLAGLGSTGLWFFKFRKERREPLGAPHVPPTLGIEDDEEKVVELLKSAGGRLLQSSLADQCGFSRSKTSKLLTLMERKGSIRRQKRGREKVVMLIGGEVRNGERTHR